jgi:hypothetical protein
MKKNSVDRRPSKKVITVAAAALLVAGGAGAAFAYWTSTGSGSGSATTGTSVAVTINQESVVTDLRPGGDAQTLSGSFTNPNEGPVYITSVTAAISAVTKAAGAPAGTCDATDFTLTGATMPVNAQVPTGTDVGDWSGATIAFDNKGDVNQDACKGATVSFTYTAAQGTPSV